jgi:isoleucyl-tRNA synthetase
VTVADVMQPRFALIPADEPPAELEQALLARWREEKLFEQTLAGREGGPSFVFFEGPPTARRPE